MSCVLLAVEAGAQQNRIDTITPMALDLAGYGSYQIGVRTMQVTDRNRPDVLSTRDGSPGATFPFVHYADAVWDTVHLEPTR